MSTPEPVITVNPVASVRDKAKSVAQAAAADNTFSAPTYGRKTAAQTSGSAGPAPQVAQATVIGETGAQGKKPSRLSGAVQTVAGGALILVGVPMLILPGPGLLAIGGGAALAVGGVKKLLRK